MLYTQDQLDQFNQHTFAYIETTESDHLLTITLNRPEKKNALSPVFFREIAYAIRYATAKRDVWGVVIDAKGDIFCAGADLKSFAGQAEETDSTVPEASREIVLGDVFNGLHKPCIAKVHAPVFAGGFLIICGCTHVIAANTATFSLPEVKRGLFPFQVMHSMLQIMPPRTVLDFCMRAKTINAEEAERISLVTKAVPADKLTQEVNTLVAELFQYSPSGIRLGLEAFENLKSIAAEDAHKYLKQMLGEALQTEDAHEGLQAFIEKRKPVWKG